jgi:hypothetical protein
MAELLNEQFSSVFSKENTSTIPNLGTSKTPDAPNIIVGKEGILKLLLNLNPHKAMENFIRWLNIMCSKVLQQIVVNDTGL